MPEPSGDDGSATLAPAAGAIAVPRRLANGVRQTLQRAQWLKKGRNVAPLEGGDQLAVVLNGGGAAAVRAALAGGCSGGGLPGELGALLAEGGGGRFLDGFRPGATLYKRDKAPVEPANGAVAEAGQVAASLPGCEQQGAFRFVELFAGIGGFHLGLQALGGRCVFASELDPEAQRVYAQNFPTELLAGDITEVNAAEIPAHELLTAGFCCQSFSRAGDEGGLGDPRGQLFYEVVRVAAHHRPAMLLLENVANLMEHDGGATIATITAELSALGYQLTHRVVNSSALLPQHRQRIYIVGFRSDLRAEFAAFRWPQLPLLQRRLEEVLEGEDSPTAAAAALSEHQWAKIKESSIYQEDPGRRAAMRAGHARTLMSSYKRGYYMHSEFVFPQEWAPRGGGVDNDDDDARPRFFTPRECARLQGFPEAFALDGLANINRLYHHLGNAVSPPIIAAIGGSMMAAAKLTEVEDAALRDAAARRHLEPALDIVLAAVPSESPGRASLQQQVDGFLSAARRGAAGALPTHSGYSNDVEEGGGVEELAALLRSPEGRAQMAALRDVARLAHGSKAGAAQARRNCAIMASRAGFVSSREDRQIPAPDGSEAARADTPQPVDGRARGMRAELQRLALVALTNLAAEEGALGALRAAGAARSIRQSLGPFDGGGEGVLSDGLRRQAMLVLARLEPAEQASHGQEPGAQ
eukprot:jgi/Tetstr1/424223/TSEL_000153.t1